MKEKNVKKEVKRITFTKLKDGSIIETIYNPKNSSSVQLAKYKDEKVEYVPEIELSDKVLFPYVGDMSLLWKKVVYLSSEATDYKDENHLYNDIRCFIHKYVGVSELFEKISAYYVLVSWIYENFNVLPYLRVIGDYGSGKSRYLLTVGSISYKAFFCGGATTAAAIFRVIERFKGTLVVDEADFDRTDISSKITKILNCGYQKGFPIVICEMNKEKNFEPKAYDVFSPKILATRKDFKDKALESRCLVERIDGKNRQDIPLELTSEFNKESQLLRNKLLMFRFRNLGKKRIDIKLKDNSIEPRLNQIILPIYSVINAKDTKNEIKELVRKYNKSIIENRGMQIEADIIEIIYKLYKIKSGSLSIKEITDKINQNEEYKKQSHRYIGQIVKELSLEKNRANKGVYIVRNHKNEQRLKELMTKFGLNSIELESENGDGKDKSDSDDDYDYDCDKRTNADFGWED